jgi:peptide subunit release factor 1 (eRF1)
VYLDINQGEASNLKRRFEVELKDRLRLMGDRLDGEKSKQFSADARRVQEYVTAFEPHGKGLIIFSDESEDLFWSSVVSVPVQTAIRWSETAWVTPLLSMLDEYERYGVALADKGRARLFTVFMREIAEHHDLVADREVRRIRNTGTDHMMSEKRLQRKVATHAKWHLKEVAETLDRMADVHRFDRLVLAGPVEATSELQHLLSKRLAARVVARMPLALEAGEAEVLERTLEVERQVQRQGEERLIESLVARDPGHPVAFGFEDVLRALQEGRIWRLVLPIGLRKGGGQCSKCFTLFIKSTGSCGYCGAPIHALDDLIERLVERVIESDGRVDTVEGNAAARLQAEREIAGILRF